MASLIKSPTSGAPFDFPELTVDAKSGVPLYVQIREQLRSLIATGVLEHGVQLPTIRSLSVALTVNPNTIAHAYSELEREGLIATQQGRGTFVIKPEDRDKLDRESWHNLMEVADKMISEACLLGYSIHDIERCLKGRLEVWNHEGGPT